MIASSVALAPRRRCGLPARVLLALRIEPLSSPLTGTSRPSLILAGGSPSLLSAPPIDNPRDVGEDALLRWTGEISAYDRNPLSIAGEGARIHHEWFSWKTGLDR